MYWNLEQLRESKALIGMSVLFIYIFNAQKSLSNVYLFQPSIKYYLNIWKIKYSVNSITWYDYNEANLWVLLGKHTLATKFKEFHFQIWEALAITINTA